MIEAHVKLSNLLRINIQIYDIISDWFMWNLFTHMKDLRQIALFCLHVIETFMPSKTWIRPQIASWRFCHEWEIKSIIFIFIYVHNFFHKNRYGAVFEIKTRPALSFSAVLNKLHYVRWRWHEPNNNNFT